MKVRTSSHVDITSSANVLIMDALRKVNVPATGQWKAFIDTASYREHGQVYREVSVSLTDDTEIHDDIDCGVVSGIYLLPRGRLVERTNDIRQKTVICSRNEALTILDRHLEHLENERVRLVEETSRLKSMKIALQ